MHITIVGTGNLARGLATRTLAGGHTVMLLGRTAGKAKALSDTLGGRARTGAVGDHLVGELIVLAIPYGAVADVLDGYGGQLDHKVLVDVTNPVDFTTFTPLAVPAGSAAQEIAQQAPGARVVKAFNTTFADTLIDGRVAGEALDVLIASDHDDAKRAVSQLVNDAGLRALDVGPLARARELEALAYLHITIQPTLGTAYTSAVKILA